MTTGLSSGPGKIWEFEEFQDRYSPRNLGIPEHVKPRNSWNSGIGKKSGNSVDSRTGKMQEFQRDFTLPVGIPSKKSRDSGNSGNAQSSVRESLGRARENSRFFWEKIPGLEAPEPQLRLQRSSRRFLWNYFGIVALQFLRGFSWDHLQ